MSIAMEKLPETGDSCQKGFRNNDVCWPHAHQSRTKQPNPGPHHWGSTDDLCRRGFRKRCPCRHCQKGKRHNRAIYHHFGGKKELFIAVAEHLEQVILDEVAETTPQGTSGWAALEWGALKTLEISIRPEIQRIVFRDAPSVVGLNEWRAIEKKYAFGLMMETLASLPPLVETMRLLTSPHKFFLALLRKPHRPWRWLIIPTKRCKRQSPH